MSQNEYPFWKGDLSQKIANFLKIRSYRGDERGDFDRQATFRYDKITKIRIMMLLSALFLFVFYLPGMHFLYLFLLITNTIHIIKKSF